jgi:hypothetical protein
MSDAVKSWDRTKPFKRINNEDVRTKQSPAQADGDGAACGCQLLTDYPDLEKEFNDAFKSFKPGKLQSAIESIQDKTQKISTGLKLVSFLINPTAAAAIQKITDLVNEVLKTTDEEIKKLLSRIGLKLAQRALQIMPQWVPVLRGASNDSVTADQVIEVEGLAARSFMNPLDVPFHQWHAWFNWNINIIPEAGYDVRSPAPDPPNTDGVSGPEEGPVVSNPSTIAVQWDSGALWGAATRAEMQKGFQARPMEAYDGPMMRDDWAWPMMNNYVWATGRWVYDCSRTTDDNPPRMCTMINPCKAIATARWQGFEFPENEPETAVPAIQFMFFTCKRGGYIDYPTITDQDYEFIVDLPRNDLKPTVPFPIGHTPDFPHNTIVMRPRLLLNLNQEPFKLADTATIEPVVEILYPDDPQKLPEQVKVKVPMTSLPADTEACGFILTMGWYDPFVEQAKKMRKCTLSFTDFSGIKNVRNSLVNTIRNELNDDEKKVLQDIAHKIGDINVVNILGGAILVKDIPLLGKKLEDLGARVVEEILKLFGEVVEEDWLLRIGVNGRWAARYQDRLRQSDIKKLKLSEPFNVDLLLSTDDLWGFAANGAEFGPVGEIMREEAVARTFKFDGKSPKWSEIVTPDADPDKARETRQKMAIAYALDLLGRGTAGFGLGRDNQPLSFLDPIQDTANFPAGDDDAQKRARDLDPIPVGVAGDRVGNESHEKQMHFARALPAQKILVENVHVDDYSIFYSVNIAHMDDV